MLIQKVDKGTDLADMLLAYVENCSWTEAKEHIAEMIRAWKFTDWETMFAAIHDGKIVGMASAMKTDYYPLPDIYPWVSCLFVSEANQLVLLRFVHYTYSSSRKFVRNYKLRKFLRFMLAWHKFLSIM